MGHAFHRSPSLSFVVCSSKRRPPKPPRSPNVPRAPREARGQTDVDSVLERELAEAGAAKSQETAADVAHALERIENGTYGWCEACGAPMPFERLQAIPSARLCVACPRLGVRIARDASEGDDGRGQRSRHDERDRSVGLDSHAVEDDTGDRRAACGAHGRGRRLPSDRGRGSVGTDPRRGEQHEQREDDRQGEAGRHEAGGRHRAAEPEDGGRSSGAGHREPRADGGLRPGGRTGPATAVRR